MNFLSQRARMVVAAVLAAAAFVAGVGVGRGSRPADTDLAMITEAQQRIRSDAFRYPGNGKLGREAVKGMLEALDDSYAEYLPRAGGQASDRPPLEQIFGVDSSALSDAAGIRGRLRSGGVATIKLSVFSPGSASLVRAELNRLRGLGARALVLDLRGNQGGLVDEALEVSGMLLGPQPVFIYETAAGGRGERNGIGEPVPDLAVVVAVDGKTASAAELVAGAVQDTGRGLIVGRKTFGKGTVQRVITLSDGSAIKLTVARYRTPSGRDVDGVGIRPDVEVASGAGDPIMDRAISLLRASGSSR